MNNDRIKSLLREANPLSDSGSLPAIDSPEVEAIYSSIADIEVKPDQPPQAEAGWRLTDDLRLELHEGIATLYFDDGGVNVLTLPILRAFREAVELCESEQEIRALTIVGRTGHFSAGLDRGIFLGPTEVMTETMVTMAGLVSDLYGAKIPIVAACTGHALAAGALLLLAADVRIGIAQSAKIGMNEASIGLPLPVWATDLARERLSRREYQRATVTAHIYTPAEAVDAGYLDFVVSDDLFPAAFAQATELAMLDPEAYEQIVRTTRWAVLERMVVSTSDQFRNPAWAVHREP